MKIKDEARWQHQLAGIASDPDPIAQKFRDWLIDWCEAAEKAIDDSRKVEYGDFGDEVVNQLNPVEALRQTLRGVEETHKHWPATLLGQALLLIQDHWEPAGDPDRFYGSLTVFEQNLFLDVAAQYVHRQMQEAADAPIGGN